MTGLRAEIHAAVGGALADRLPTGPDVEIDVIVDAVFAVLEERLGATQERLLLDLQYARAERDAASRRAAALAGECAALAARLAHYESSDA